MNAKHQFKYTYNETDMEEFSPVDITFEVPGDVTLQQMLYNLQSYLKAVGFVFDGELQIVDDALDNIDTADEIYGCMADWDKDEEESSCCNEGCGCEDYKDQKLKEWNEGLKNLEKLMQQKKRERENN